MYEALTNLIERIENTCPGKWMVDNNHAGTKEDPKRLPWVKYDESLFELQANIVCFMKEHEYLHIRNTNKYLVEKGIDMCHVSMIKDTLSQFDGTTIMAMFDWILRSERFYEGNLLELAEDGTIVALLRRLKEIDMGL